jgi:hypothetical protein
VYLEAIVRGADWASIQILTASGADERWMRPGRKPEQRACTVPETHVRARHAGAAAALEATKSVTRFFVRALYLFPLLILVKATLHLLEVPAGELITLVFVLTVVLVFALLSLAALLHVYAGPRSERAARRRMTLALPDRAPPQLGPAEVHVRGRIDAGGDAVPGEPVLAERWHESGGRVVRVLEGRSFAVVPDEGEPVVLDLQACPRLVGPYAPRDEVAIGELSRELLAGEDTGPGAMGCDLRQGDLVEIAAPHGESVPADTVEAVQLRRGDAPYRGESGRVHHVVASDAVTLRLV